MAVDDTTRSMTPVSGQPSEPTATSRTLKGPTTTPSNNPTSDTRRIDTPTGTTTFVSVVFEPELDLLQLQARSFARFADPCSVSAILVIDNTRSGLGPYRQLRLQRAYGPLGDRVRIIRQDAIDSIPASTGWITQQVLKLVVSGLVDTRHYVVLDAKNQFVRPVSIRDFENPDGRARGASHGYRSHSLRPQLERVLAYLGIDAESWLDHFPVTHTPVILETAVVRDLIDWVVRTSGNDFATEFVDHGLLEFFLYSGWLIRSYGDVDGHLDGSVVRSANVWPGRSAAANFRQAVEDATRLDAPIFSAHRTALAKAGLAGVRIAADFWVDRGLFDNGPQALLFIARFKIRYGWWILRRKVHQVPLSRRGANTR